ncbi:MAG: hypothetical protein RR521_11965 [Clostridia bacterium]
MKRAVLILSVLLALGLTSAHAAEYTANSTFTITYDDAVFTLDDTGYPSNIATDDTYRWLFLLNSDEYLIDVSMESWHLLGYEGDSLLTASEAEKQAYVADALSAYSATLLKTVEVGSEKIPFVLFYINAEGGDCLVAETLVSGYVIDFNAYYRDASRDADDALAEHLLAILDSFTPVLIE